jgi:hypothetical protein
MPARNTAADFSAPHIGEPEEVEKNHPIATFLEA